MEYLVHKRHVLNGTDPVRECEWCRLILTDKISKLYPHHQPGSCPGEETSKWPSPAQSVVHRPPDRLADETRQSERSAAKWGAFMDYVLGAAADREYELELTESERCQIRKWLEE